MNLSLVSNGRAVGTKADANGKFRRPADYTIDTFRDYLELARTHVGVFVVNIKREVAAQIAAQAETLLKAYGKSSRMSGRPYKKVLLKRIETKKWNNGYGISQIAENGAPINGLTRFDTHGESSADYLTYTLSFGCDANDYYQFDESQSTRTNEDHWLTQGYDEKEAKFLSGVRLAANLGLPKANKIIDRDGEVEWYDGHKDEVELALGVMNRVLAEQHVPYKEALFGTILAKGILNAVNGGQYLNLITNVLIDGHTTNKWEAKFKSLFDLLRTNDVKKSSVWATLRKAADLTLEAKHHYDVGIAVPLKANTKNSVKLLVGSWKQPEDAFSEKPKAKAKKAKAAKAGK